MNIGEALGKDIGEVIANKDGLVDEPAKTLTEGDTTVEIIENTAKTDCIEAWKLICKTMMGFFADVPSTVNSDLVFKLPSSLNITFAIGSNEIKINSSGIILEVGSNKININSTGINLN